MTLAIVHTRASLGIDAPAVTVEAHLSNGLPSLAIVGLPETVVKESRDRVRSAILNSHFEFPARRITINLAPADLPKEGARYDLPIAIGILAASGQIPLDSLADHEFIGELALSGELRPVCGVLAAAQCCAQTTTRRLITPHDNAREASLIEKPIILPARHLLEVSAHLHKTVALNPTQSYISPQTSDHTDLSDLIGQQQARRALEIAAAGQHNLLMVGPPGSGKTMLANRLPGILPPLSRAEMIETATIHSLCGATKGSYYESVLSFERPFRAPHHTASPIALAGGGSNPKPGEISMAHLGVLFLDELPEFQRKVLEVLREPLENGKIILSRANNKVCYPARFQLVAAMNPCPCGYFGSKIKECRCTPDLIRRYREKISGPLLDRIDLQINIDALPSHLLVNGDGQNESSNLVRQRVVAARAIQLGRGNTVNTCLTNAEVGAYCQIKAEDKDYILKAICKLGLSARAYNKVLKVARTIADLETCRGNRAGNEMQIERRHLQEALSYRGFERLPL